MVPIALAERALDETAPPNWLPCLTRLNKEIPHERWGTAKFPIFVTSSNFGVGSLYAFHTQHNSSHLRYGTPHACVEWLSDEMGWQRNVTVLSHACVSAHLGLLLASRVLHSGSADRALVFSFDFISPFVAGGFQALKILNSDFPAPWTDRATGSIGLGDGAAFAVLERPNTLSQDTGHGNFQITAQHHYNEMHQFTANNVDGSGFKACLRPLQEATEGRRIWLKGHGTGTLEAGRLECDSLSHLFPGAPLVGWKGSLGHTLGSCGLVELALAVASVRSGYAPGTIGSEGPHFSPSVRPNPISLSEFDGVICASNAFGGAHAAILLTHD